jgi:hypothetical protein
MMSPVSFLDRLLTDRHLGGPVALEKNEPRQFIGR